MKCDFIQIPCVGYSPYSLYIDQCIQHEASLRSKPVVFKKYRAFGDGQMVAFMMSGSVRYYGWLRNGGYYPNRLGNRQKEQAHHLFYLDTL